MEQERYWEMMEMTERKRNHALTPYIPNSFVPTTRKRPMNSRKISVCHEPAPNDEKSEQTDTTVTPPKKATANEIKRRRRKPPPPRPTRMTMTCSMRRRR